MYEQRHCCGEAASHQLVAHSCGLVNHLNSFHRGMFKLNAKFDAYSLSYSLSHFECNSHTVHMISQQSLPPPLTAPSEVIIVHTCTFQPTLLGCQFTSMSHKPFLFY